MSLRRAVAVTLLLTALGMSTQSSAQSADEQAVRQAEDRRIKAMVDDDYSTLEALLADDLTYTHSSGLLDTKAQYLEALKTGKTKYEAIDRSPSTVRIYGPSAVVNGEASLTMRGQPAKVNLRYTLVYARRSGRWQMVAWQSTRLPAAQ